MATYNPKISLSSAPGVTGYLYLVLAEATSPNTPVANSGQIPPPHGSSIQIQFTGLNPVIHIGTLYETDGVSTTGVVRANFSLDPQYPGVEIRPNLYIVAGTTPGFTAGGNSYTDPDDSLAEWDYELFITGYGFINPAKYTVDANNNPSITDSGTGNPTFPGEEWVFVFAPRIIVFNPTANSGGNLIGDVVVIEEDTALDDTYMGKQIIGQGANSTLVLTLPDIETVTVNKLLMIQAEGGSNINTVINAFSDGGGTDPIDFKGTEVDKIILGRGEEVSFYKWVDPNDSNNVRWKVKFASAGIKMVGEKVYHDLKDDADLMELNLIFLDGRDDLDKEVYARLWDYVSNVLPPAMLVTQAAWATDKGKFYEVDADTFGLPQLYLTGFLRGVDGSARLTGTNQDLQMLDHKHEGATGTLPSSLFGRGKTNRTIGQYNGTTNNLDDLTSSPVDADGDPLTASVGTENRPANTGTYILLRI